MAATRTQGRLILHRVAAIYGATLATIVASVVVGHAIWTLCGLGGWWWGAPAVGLATLVTVAAVTVELPGEATTSAAALALVVALSALKGGSRSSLLARAREGVPVALIVLASVALPFAVSGRAGILIGANNNDLTVHLTAAYWLQTHDAVPPRLLEAGYPLGPHAFAASLGQISRLSLPAVFTGLTLAVPVLSALAALAALPRAAAPLRWAAATLVGLAYLAASYLAQGAFKETLQALFLLAFALGLREVAERRVEAWRAAVPLGLLVGGMVSTYSYYGVVWPAATVVLLLAVQVAVKARGTTAHRARLEVTHAARAGAVGLFTLALAAGAQAGRMITFSDSTFANTPLDRDGNLLGPISPFEVLGVWPTGDFRFPPASEVLTWTLVAVAVVAFALSLAGWIRRGSLALPAAVGASMLVYWQATLHKNAYAAAKALAVAAPLVALIIGAGLLLAASRRPGLLSRHRRRMLIARALTVTLALAVAVAAAVSSALALGDALVAGRAHERDLEKLRPLVSDSPTLFLGNDDFVHWELRGARLATPRPLYATWVPPTRDEKGWHSGAPFDFDSFSPETLDEMRYVVTTGTPYASAAPPNFAVRRRTRWFTLWERKGPTAARSTFEAPGEPAATLDCSTRVGRSMRARRGVASVLPTPVVRAADAWSEPVRGAGETATLPLRLPRGTWDISLQYVSREGVRLEVGSLRVDLPPNLGRMGPYWFAGTVHVDRPGTVRVRATIADVSLVGKVLRAPGETLAPNAIDFLPLGGLAATRHGARPAIVPLAHACGRYVDWYRLET